MQDKCFEMTTEEAEMASSIDIYTKIAKVTTFFKMRLLGISSHDITFIQKKPFFFFVLCWSPKPED